MPHYCTKMNDGKWRVYSTIVDDYITDDMSFEELKAWRREVAIQRADEESDTLLTERPRINYCTQDDINFCTQDGADLWSGRANASDGLSEPLGGIPDEEEF